MEKFEDLFGDVHMKRNYEIMTAKLCSALVRPLLLNYIVMDVYIS